LVGWIAAFARTNQDEYSALNLAALSGHSDCVRLLLEAGADVDHTSNVRKDLQSRVFLLMYTFEYFELCLLLVGRIFFKCWFCTWINLL
jgi:ankyrin repeat protein